MAVVGDEARSLYYSTCCVHTPYIVLVGARFCTIHARFRARSINGVQPSAAAVSYGYTRSSNMAGII
jgi:hypothetical protein